MHFQWLGLPRLSPIISVFAIQGRLGSFQLSKSDLHIHADSCREEGPGVGWRLGGRWREVGGAGLLPALIWAQMH